jgi:hypothetical protein
LNSSDVAIGASLETASRPRSLAWPNKIFSDKPTGFLFPGQTVFEVTINDSNQAVLDKGRLSAVLSLWLYTIAKRRKDKRIPPIITDY